MKLAGQIMKSASSPGLEEETELRVTICYQPVKIDANTVGSNLAFFEILKRIAGYSGYANEFTVGRNQLNHLRVFRDSLEYNSVDYKSIAVIIDTIEAHGDVRVWLSF